MPCIFLGISIISFVAKLLASLTVKGLDAMGYTVAATKVRKLCRLDAASSDGGPAELKGPAALADGQAAEPACEGGT